MGKRRTEILILELSREGQRLLKPFYLLYSITYEFPYKLLDK